MSGVRVHDFRLTDGNERCSIITGLKDGPLVQIDGTYLTIDQLEELYFRVKEFDFDQEGDDVS